MSEKVERIRNIALIGHGGAGKTSLAEALLYNSGTIKRLGNVGEGNTAMDFEPEELKRTSSISSGFHQYSWKNHTVNLIDTPGDQNFFSDTKSCMQAADGVAVVIDAVDGVKVQTELALEFAKEFKSALRQNRLFSNFPLVRKMNLKGLWISSATRPIFTTRTAKPKKKTSLPICRTW
jgi:elongation factor G